MMTSEQADNAIRKVVSEQIVQDAEVIENLRIKLANLRMAAKELGFHNAPAWLTAERSGDE